MYNLLIVDDEPLEREAMRLILTKNIPGIAICGEAENGFDAISLVAELKPDIVLLDINMPGMDGLATIEKMQQMGLQTRFIILTSYSSFDYARKALRLGVEDFLVKPADLDTVRNTIITVIDSIETESIQIMTQEKMKDKINEMQPVVQSDIFRAICEKQKDVRNMFELLEFHPKEAFVAVIDSGSNGDILYSRICRILNSNGIHFISRIHSSMIDLLIFSQSEHESLKQIGCIELLADSSGSFYLGCGSSVDNVDLFYQSYQEAVSALQEGRRDNKRIFFFTEIKNHKKDRFPVDRYVDLFCSQIQMGDRDEIISLSELFFSDLSGRDEIDLMGRQTYVYQALIQISRKISEKTGFYRLWEEILTDKLQLLENRDTASLKLHFLSILEQFLDKIKDRKESRQDLIVKRVMIYVEDQYENTISLEDLAESLNLSPSHISKVIKKTTGQNLPEILNKFRINKAMQLLREELFSIKEITYRVGYNSQHYFSRIFKRETGFSPSDFRNRDY
ncbi:MULTISPECIES: response regulator [unclassified Oceanispirochaeta]|uniref:response regulator n=1 Tax=unclassified Oceanispirochaeta TaxID=2635722 RepID=UPI001314793B|nr:MULTISPECIES: response regulator [unclassified Oceanispirochaeta]MBF9017295.1 response regulator [Oceanispirochaeta sp. M2]NPD73805.1 response regulator [Oceanispirochaeta sp. M1]